MTTYNTGNPVGSADPKDLYDNAQNLDNIVNGSELSYADRLGVARRSLAGIDAAAEAVLSGLGYAPPVAYASGIYLTLTTQTVEYNGEVYAPKLSALPFTTGGTFDSTKFRIIQGVIATDLAATGGSALVGADDGASGSLWTTIQGFINRLTSSFGLSTIGFQQNYAAAVAQVAATPLSNIVSVSDFMTAQQVDEMHGGVVRPDITAAFQAAVNAFPRQGTPNWQPWKLLLPFGVATLSSTVLIRNQQGSEIHMGGCVLIGNFAGPLIQVGDDTGLYDVLWTHFYGGRLEQYSTAAGSACLKAVHNYSCSYSNMFMYGGRTVFDLDGNANLISCCTFRGGVERNVKAAGTSNNEANTFHVCSNEQGQGYGYDLDVPFGAGGLTVIQGGYVEANVAANIRCRNAQKVAIRDVYFNLDNGAVGVLLDGTVNARYPDAFVEVQGCQVLGHATAAAPFIKENSTSSINAQYRNNSVVTGLVDLYSQAPRSINLSRRGKSPSIVNGTSIVNTDGVGAPDGWTLSSGGTGNVATPAANSPYVTGTAAEISPSNQYIYQSVKVPANALVRASVWANATGASTPCALQIWSTGLGAKLAEIETSSTTPTKLTIYLSPSDRASDTSFVIMLRNPGGVANAVFSDIEIEDMTN